MDIQRKQIGKRIKLRRRTLQLTQEQVAEFLDCSNNTISAIETGKQNITLEALLKLCDILNTTPNHLLLGNMHPNDAPQDIVDTLRLCNADQIRLIRDFTEMIYTRKHDTI